MKPKLKMGGGGQLDVMVDGEVIFSESASGTDTAYGIGLGIWVGKNVTLRGEGEWFTIGDFDTVALYSFNVTYTF